jgi:hypothetical protein
VAPGSLCDDPAGHHQDFFVRKRYRFPALDGRQHRFETVRARRSAQDEIDIGMRRHCRQAFTS